MSTGSSPPAERTLRAWLASRSARSMRIHRARGGGRRAPRRAGRRRRRASPRPAAGKAGMAGRCGPRAAPRANAGRPGLSRAGRNTSSGPSRTRSRCRAWRSAARDGDGAEHGLRGRTPPASASIAAARGRRASWPVGAPRRASSRAQLRSTWRRASVRAACAAPLGRPPTAGRARALVRSAGSSSDRPGASRAGHAPCQATASPAVFLDDQLERLVRRFDQRPGAAVELVAEAALGGGEEQALVGQPRRRIDAEIEAREVADRLRPDADLAVGGDGDRKRVRSARADVADQDGGAAVDEALGQPFVQRVRRAAPRPRGCARPIWPARPASRRGARYRPSCGCPARRSASASMSPLTLSSRVTSAANHSCGMCPPSPM